jgi:hypothetical protein
MLFNFIRLKPDIIEIGELNYENYDKQMTNLTLKYFLRFIKVSKIFI